MASSMWSDYLANKIQDHLTGVAAYTPPTQINVGLYTARGTIVQSCAGTNFTEVVGFGYARVNVGIGSTNWFSSAARTTTNKLSISMGTPTGGDFGTIIGYFAYDNSGNLLWFSDFVVSKICPNGVPISFDVSAMSLSLPQGA